MKNIIYYTGEVTQKFSEDGKHITEIMIGDKKILSGVWSIFNDISKDKNIIFALWWKGYATEVRRKLAGGKWSRIIGFTGKVRREITKDGKFINCLSIGRNGILRGNWSAFKRCKGKYICLTTEEIESIEEQKNEKET